MKKVYGIVMLLAGMSFISTEALAQYCTPRTSSSWGGISKVTTSGGSINISKTTSASSGVRNYTGSDSIAVKLGGTFTVTVSHRYNAVIYIDWNDDGDFRDAGEHQGIMPNSYFSGSRTSNWTINVPSNKAYGQLRMRIYTGYYYYFTPDYYGRGTHGCGYSSYQGEVEDYRVWVAAPLKTNAAITELLPAAPCTGSNAIQVRITNMGTDTLKSVTVSGSIKNNVSTTTTNYGPTVLTGLSLARLQDTVYTITNYTLAAATTYDVDFKTTLPNGVSDMDTTNDAISKKGMAAALGGSYTIGSSTGADYNTLKAAEVAMKTYGICGPTVFNIEAGTYTEQVKFTTYTGISATNNVRFRPHPSNTGRVRWEFSATSSTDGNRGTAVFTGTQYVSIDSITMVAKSTSRGNVLEFNSAPKYLSFTGDSLIAPKVNTTSNYYAVVYNYQKKAEYITIKDCDLLNGSASIYCYGNSSNQLKGWVVENNRMLDWYYMGMYWYYMKDAEINWNVIKNNGNYGYPRGIYSYYGYTTNINYNEVILDAKNYGYGLYCYYNRAGSSNRKTISNNMVSITGGSGYHYPMYFRYCDYTDIDFNSSSIEKGNGYNVYLYYGSSVNYRNNVHKHLGSGYKYYQRGSQTRSNNAWWAPNASSSSGSLGTNVLNVDPKFKSLTDLHSASTSLHNSGLAVTGWNKDIDKDVRCPGTGCPGNATAPDRGADEFWLPDYDIQAQSLNSVPCSGVQTVQVKVANIGVKTLTSFKVDWSINGVAQTQLTVSSSSVGIGKDTVVTLGTHTYVSGVSYNMVYYTSLPSGQSDQQAFNDTLKEVSKNAVSGTFSVGSGGDYPGLDSAVNEITRLGICGPVVLQLMDSTFAESVIIDNINGNSMSNTFTITKHPMNTNDAIIKGTLTISNVEYITVKGIVFDNSSNTIQLGASVSNIYIDSNTFNQGTGGYALYDNDRSGNIDSLWFSNNTVNGGNGGIYFYGSSGNQDKNILIENNKIEGWAQYGLNFWYGKNLALRGNSIKSGKGLSYGPYAIYTWYINNFELTGNQIHTYGTGGGYGIYSRYANFSGASNSDSLIMTNNFISAYTKGTGTPYGAYLYYNYRTKAHHNNFSLVSSSRGYALYSYRMVGSDFKNNVFGSNGGTTWYNGSTTPTHDYNAFWNGTGSGTSITLGSNSLTTNPRYKKTEVGDLRVNSIQLDSGGVNLGVATDIFGSPRKNPPDIGAHEFDPCYYDAVAKEYYSRYVQIPNTQSVRMYGTVGNLGLDSITGVNANGAVGTSTATVPLGTIYSDADSSFSIAVPLTGITGNVNASLFTTMTQTDCDVLNDTLKYAFEATDSVYAYDDSTFDNTLGYNPPFTGEFGSVFEIFNTDTISSGTFRLDGPTQGATVRLLVYNFIDSTGMPGSIIDSTRSFVVGKSGTGWYTLPFGCAGIVAQPGKYLVTIEQSNPVRMNLAINTLGTGVAKTRWERGTGGSWSDLYSSSSAAVKNATLGLRVNLGTVKEADVLPANSLICNNSSTFLQLDKKYDRQIWSNGLLFDSILVSAPGVYKVTVWDAIGCMYSDSTTATMATAMVVSGTPAKATCGMSDGSVALSVTGAYPPHTYAWDNGATTQNLSNVAGDDYTVVITDSIGCQNTQTVKVLGAFPELSSMWSYPTCNGDNNGTATSMVDKGVMPYTYSWNAGGSTNTATNTNLTAGSYIVDVTDASGCVTKDTVTVKDPAVLASNNVIVQPTACKLADASAEAQMTGGIAPYNFLWSNGQTSGKAVGLTEGIYDVTITDSLGCVVISKMTVMDPNSPISIPNNQLLDCSYDTTTVKVNIQGGTAPFTYNWDYKNMKTSSISGVASGSYKLHLVDAKGCDHDTIVEISAPMAVAVQFDNYVDSAGVAKVTANTSGGSPAYSWKWSNGETTQRAVNLPNGVNKVEVVDAKGCSFTYQLDVEITTVSVSYLSNPAVFNIYPNPTQGNVYIDLNLNSVDDVRVRVLNPLGKVVETIERGNVAQDNITIDMSSYSVGVYLVETTIGSEKVVSRIQLTK